MEKVKRVENDQLVSGKKAICVMSNGHIGTISQQAILLPGRKSVARSNLTPQTCEVGQPLCFLYEQENGDSNLVQTGSKIAELYLV